MLKDLLTQVADIMTLVTQVDRAMTLVQATLQDHLGLQALQAQDQALLVHLMDQVITHQAQAQQVLTTIHLVLGHVDQTIAQDVLYN